MTRATIEDVARRAGVTKSTVSHALSGKRPVSVETRRRIDAAILALGYRPNPVAQRLAAGRSGAVGFIYPLVFESRPGHAATWQPDVTAVFAAAGADVAAAGFALMLFTQPGADASGLTPFLEAGMLDGAVVGQVQMHDERVRGLRSAGVPFVMLGRTEDNSDLNFVDVDVDAAVEECVEHLAGLGHRRIAFLHEDPRGAASAARSLQAYERACARRRLRIQAATCPPSAARSTAEELLRHQPEISALIVAGDLAAWGAQAAARTLGRILPDDLSLVCLGKTWVSEALGFGATGVDLRGEEQARHAVQLLLGLLGDAPAGDTQVLLEPRWVAGDTTGPVA